MRVVVGGARIQLRAMPAYAGNVVGRGAKRDSPGGGMQGYRFGWSSGLEAGPRILRINHLVTKP
ncbi:MAG TPA: hypothetical protein VGN55_06315 [Xanthobacteraceae bacterium]